MEYRCGCCYIVVIYIYTCKRDLLQLFLKAETSCDKVLPDGEASLQESTAHTLTLGFHLLKCSTHTYMHTQNHLGMSNVCKV